MFGIKEPVPLDVHIPVVVPPETDPDNEILRLLTQTTLSTPALTFGALVIVTSNWSCIKLQLFAVKVSVTDPIAVSVWLGIYTAFKAELFGTKTPDPEVDQTPVVAPPDTVPLKNTDALFPHTVWFAPAFTIPVGKIVTNNSSSSKLH